MNILKLKNDLIEDEGLKLKPYKCTAGKTTIGVGRNLDDVGISKDEADFMLENDIKRVIAELTANLSFFNKLSENRQIALANMCFNLGIKRLLKFNKMITAMAKGDFVTASLEALDSQWAIQVQPSRVNRIIDMIRNG